MQNKYGICEWVLPASGPFALTLAGELGYDGIQLGDLGGMGMDYPLNKKRIQEGYVQAARESGVEIQAIHLHTLVRDGTMIHPMESEMGKKAQESLKNGIDACAAMGVPKLMVSAFFGTLIRNDVDFDNYAAMLKYSIAYGRDKNVSIVFETVLSIERQLKMLDAVGEGLRFCYDTLNPVRWGTGDPSVEIRQLGADVIDHIHVKDMPADMVGCYPLGEGVARFEESAKVLKDIGFAGWIVTENYFSQPPMPALDHDPFALAVRDLAAMKRAFVTVKQESP